MSDKHGLARWLPALLGGNDAGRLQVIEEFATRLPPPKIGWMILAQLFKADKFSLFDTLCQVAGRGWALTPPNLNEKLVEAALQGDVRWMASVFHHKLTQVDHFDRQGRKGWLRVIIDRASPRKDAWGHVQNIMATIPSGWSGGFGRDILPPEPRDAAGKPPEHIRQALRTVESTDAAHRQWCQEFHAADPAPPPSPDAWRRSESPLMHWLRVFNQQLLQHPEKIDATLRKGLVEAKLLTAAGADAGAWCRGRPLLLELGEMEAVVRRINPALASKVVDIFDVLVPSADVRVEGFTDLSSFREEEGMNIAEGFASFGGISLARRAMELGCREDHVDAMGRGWLWHAWSCGTPGLPPCPPEQVHLTDTHGMTLLHGAVNFLFTAQGQPHAVPTQGQLVDMIVPLLRAGLSLDEKPKEFDTPREVAMRAASGVFQAVLDAQARVLQESMNACGAPAVARKPRL